jgi:hypothetical protein
MDKNNYSIPLLLKSMDAKKRKAGRRTATPEGITDYLYKLHNPL